MLTQLVYILDRKYKADRMLNFVLMRSGFCHGVIHWINLYPMDSAIGFSNTYLLDSDL